MTKRTMVAITALAVAGALSGATAASALVTPGPYWTGVRPPAPVPIIRR